MNTLFARTVHDLRSGRTTWRVFALLAVPAFVAGAAAAMFPIG